MICLFCKSPMKIDGYDLIKDGGDCTLYSCISSECKMPGNFPRYRCSALDHDDRIIQQEYAITKGMYVRVNRHGTTISKLESAMTSDDVRISRSLWLNSTNYDEVLDKLKMCVIFS